MKFIRNPELKGILAILFIALVVGVLLAGSSGKLEQWGLPWFTGAKVTDKIIFESDRSGARHIYSMNLDGSNQKQLTDGDIKILSAPAMSPAGNRIAFVGMLGAADQVFAIGAEGGRPHPLTTSANSKRQPGYSPNGKKLAYIESGRVFIAELSGSNPDPVLPTEQEMAMAMNSQSGGHDAIPVYSMYSWAQDSEGIAGVTQQDGADTVVYLPSPEGEAQRFNTGDPMVKVVGLSWATDKPVLAVSIQAGEAQGLMVLIEPDQKQPKAIYAQPALIRAPAISPDASCVVANVLRLTVRPPMPVLLKIDTQTGKSKVLCKGAFESLLFSPKGDKILATAMTRNGKRNIVTIDAESGKVTILTNKGDNSDAIWSPQSK